MTEKDHEINQCDGCRRGLPLRSGIHYGNSNWDVIGCTADLYSGDSEQREPLPWQLVVQAIRAVGNFMANDVGNIWNGRSPQHRQQAYDLVINDIEKYATATRYNHKKMIDVAVAEHLRDWPKIPRPISKDSGQ